MIRNNKFDLIIVGGGAAAFSAAIKANMHEVKTAMIERGSLGGTCINVGCIPSKNLLGAGQIVHTSKKPSYQSVFPCNSNFDFSKAIADKDCLVRYLQSEKYYDVLSGLDHVELIEADGSFISDKKLKVTNGVAGNKRILEADKFIIATGSSASAPQFDGMDNIDYLTNVEALSLKEKPSSMIVVGGRALGLEFAQMYSRFGTKVTLLQRSERIIPNHEPEISDALYNYLIEEGIEIITGVDLKSVHQKNGVKFAIALVKGGIEKTVKTFETEQLLMATGRKPNTADLHLENAGVKLRKEDGAIIVNSEMKTTAPHIWAGGDVIGEPMLETAAAKEGATAAENAIKGSHKRVDLISIPSAIFTSPQVASVGLTEQQMMERYGYCSCKTVDMKQVPKALTVNETKGLIKMTVDPAKNNRILGVHILANIAADMIHEAVIAVKYRLTIDDIIDTVHVFPTMTEAIKLVATTFKQDINKLSCCAE
ncbi:MAG: mercury(II) reductase [Nitrososphaeraceae archaeon]